MPKDDISLSDDRLRWHCRRGLLELDLLLQQFLDRRLSALTPEDRVMLRDLLMQSDVELMAWLREVSECEEERFHPLLRAIQANGYQR
jgi:antitoxin CptB